MRFSTIVASLASLALPFVQADHAHAARHNKHAELARRAKGDVSLFERSTFTNARFTYYAVGLGACGKTNVPSDFIVALNVEQYGGGYPGPFCFEMITISYGGKTAQAQIMDECMGCPYGGLDFSQDLFEYFSDLGAGVLYGEWWFNGDSGGGSGGGDSTTTTYHTTPTTTWQPSTTWTPPPPPPTTTKSSTHKTSSTSTWSPPSSSSSSTHSSSSTPSTTSTHSSTWSSSSSISSTSSASTSSASATPSVAVLQSLNQAILGAGAIIAGGAQN